MAGKDTGEVRKRFFGNPEIAQRFMGPARLLLGQLKEDMAFNSLQQGVRRAVIRINQRIEIGPELSKEGDADITRRFVQLLGSVAIVATSSHGQSEVWIDATAVNTTEVVERKVPEGRYEPSLLVTFECPIYLLAINSEAPSGPAAFVRLWEPQGPDDSRGPEISPGHTENTEAALQSGYFLAGTAADTWHQDIPVTPPKTQGFGYSHEVQTWFYAPSSNGVCPMAFFPSTIWPEPMERALAKAIAMVEEGGRSLLFLHYGSFLDPGSALPFEQKVLPGWYFVDLTYVFSTIASYQESNEFVFESSSFPPGSGNGTHITWTHHDFRIVVELGKPPQRFEFAFTLAPGETWDKSLLIDVENGVIAEIPRPGDNDFQGPIPQPGPGTKFYYHHLSPLLAEQSQ